MRWNVGPTSYSTAPVNGSSLPAGHPEIPLPLDPSSSTSSRLPASCPMSSSSSSPPTNLSTPAKCPVIHDASSSSSSMNPLNIIPSDLSSSKSPNQTIDLPTERTPSTIPRPITDPQDGKVWDYPSPQQFYNALVRKGWETPEESIETVVAIHNFLNERAWQEVLRWEAKRPGGEHAQLARFQGKPGELSPKARMTLWAGKLFPSKFNTTPPFDRHDWVVTRPTPSSQTAETTTTRYVIDYYSAPPDEEGNPVFSLDVRPALDSLGDINYRVKMGIEELLRGEQEA